MRCHLPDRQTHAENEKLNAIFEKPLDCTLGGRLMVKAEVVIMLIHEAMKQTGTTKKAIEYYCEKGLLKPQYSDSGYRVFSDEDIDCLKKIALLRNLDLSIEEIKALLNSNDNTAFQKIIAEQERELNRKKEQNELLKELAASKDWNAVSLKAAAKERVQSVTDRLTKAFPGFWGKYLSLHFGRFLNSPVQSEEQENAYREVCEYLDGVQLEIPEEMEAYLDEMNTESAQDVFSETDAALSDAVNDTEGWLKDHKELIDQYLEFTKTPEYRNSAGYRFKELMTKFNQEKGYNSVFIPAMRRLSPSYDAYMAKLLKANQIFLNQYRQ